MKLMAMKQVYRQNTFCFNNNFQYFDQPCDLFLFYFGLTCTVATVDTHVCIYETENRSMPSKRPQTTTNQPGVEKKR